jgi:hypothetical protein
MARILQHAPPALRERAHRKTDPSTKIRDRRVQWQHDLTRRALGFAGGKNDHLIDCAIAAQFKLIKRWRINESLFPLKRAFNQAVPTTPIDLEVNVRKLEPIGIDTTKLVHAQPEGKEKAETVR